MIACLWPNVIWCGRTIPAEQVAVRFAPQPVRFAPPRCFIPEIARNGEALRNSLSGCDRILVDAVWPSRRCRAGVRSNAHLPGR